MYASIQGIVSLDLERICWKTKVRFNVYSISMTIKLCQYHFEFDIFMHLKGENFACRWYQMVEIVML